MSIIYINIYGGFLKWWYPTTIGFPSKNDHFGVFWGYHHLRKHPYIWSSPRQGRRTQLVSIEFLLNFCSCCCSCCSCCWCCGCCGGCRCCCWSLVAVCCLLLVACCLLLVDFETKLFAKKSEGAEQSRGQGQSRTKRTETDGKGGREKRQERAKERSSRTERNRAELSSGASGMEQHREKDQNRAEERNRSRKERQISRRRNFLEPSVQVVRPFTPHPSQRSLRSALELFSMHKTFLELNSSYLHHFCSVCAWIEVWVDQYPISVKRHASVWRHVSARTPPALGQQLTIAANFGRGWNPAEAGRRSVLQTSTLPSAACRRESRESTTGAERGGTAAHGCEWSKRLTAVVVEGWLWWKKDSLSIFACVVAVRMCYLCVRFRLFVDCIVCCLPFINFLVVLFPPSSLCSVFTFKEFSVHSGCGMYPGCQQRRGLSLQYHQYHHINCYDRSFDYLRFSATFG